jgi:hypothetical protein
VVQLTAHLLTCWLVTGVASTVWLLLLLLLLQGL